MPSTTWIKKHWCGPTEYGCVFLLTCTPLCVPALQPWVWTQKVAQPAPGKGPSPFHGDRQTADAPCSQCGAQQSSPQTSSCTCRVQKQVERPRLIRNVHWKTLVQATANGLCAQVLLNNRQPCVVAPNCTCPRTLCNEMGWCFLTSNPCLNS